MSGTTAPYYNHGTNCMEGRGPLDASILIIGEAPGENEDYEGEPFVGMAGSVLTRCLIEAGLDEAEDVRITNAVRCRPCALKTKGPKNNRVSWENRAPTGDEIVTCADSWLIPEIESMPNLQLVIPMGNVPLFAVEGRYRANKIPKVAPGAITKSRGKVFESEFLGRGIHVLPTFHPAYILRAPQYEEYLIQDLKTARNFIEGNKKVKHPVKYREFRTPADFQLLVNEIKKAGEVAWDTETTSKDHVHMEKILCFTFSFSPFCAAYVPWFESKGDFTPAEGLRNYWYDNYGPEGYAAVLQGLREIFEDPAIRKIGQNLGFDARFIQVSAGLGKVDGVYSHDVLEPMGIVLRNWHFDTMIAHFMLHEDLPHDLKSMAELYTDMGAYDSDLDEAYKEVKRGLAIENNVRARVRTLLETYDATGEVDIAALRYSCGKWNIDLPPVSNQEGIQAVLEDLRSRPTQPIHPHYGMIDLDMLKVYAMSDADCTYRLYRLFAPLLVEEGVDKVFYKLRMPISAALAKAELAGIAVDVKLVAETSEKFTIEQDAIASRIAEAVGREVNIASVPQLQALLYNSKEDNGLGLEPPSYTDTGAPSTDKKALEKLASGRKSNPILRDIVQWRRLALLKSTFLDGMVEKIDPVTGRVHPGFLVARAATQRIVCASPNLLNIPRDDPGNPDAQQEGSKIRNIFIPRPSPSGTPIGETCVFVDGDLSQAELRTFAGLSGASKMIEMFHNKIDIHSFFANIIYHHELPEEELYRFKNKDANPVMYAQRSRTKNMVFGTLYGQNAYGAEKTLGIPQEEAQEIIDTFFRLCPEGKEWITRTQEFAVTNKYVKTPLGVRRHLPVLEPYELDPTVTRDCEVLYRVRYSGLPQPITDTKAIAEALRIAVNTIIQTHASDYNCIAFLETCKTLEEMGVWFEPKLVIYDAIILECMLKDAALVRDVQYKAMTRQRRGYPVPMDAEIDVVDRWSGNHIDIDKSLAESRLFYA